MIPLIDSYTLPEFSRTSPLTALKEFQSEYTRGVSTIVVGSKKVGLNYRIHKLLKEYSNLQDDWDEDEGLAPKPNVIQYADYIATLLEQHGQPIFHTAPGPRGEIMLDIRDRYKRKSLEVVLYPDRAFIVFFPEQGKASQEAFDINQFQKYLEWLNQN